MLRPLLILALLSFTAACAPTLKSIDRGQWVLVTTDDVRAQELIPRDNYDSEVVSGRERRVKFAVDEKPPVLHDAESPLTIKVGEIARYRLNEGTNVDVQSDEAVVETYWTENYRVDGWKDNEAVEQKESIVYLRGLKPGKGKLRLVDSTWGNVDFEVLVVK